MRARVRWDGTKTGERERQPASDDVSGDPWLFGASAPVPPTPRRRARLASPAKSKRPGTGAGQASKRDDQDEETLIARGVSSLAARRRARFHEVARPGRRLRATSGGGARGRRRRHGIPRLNPTAGPRCRVRGRRRRAPGRRGGAVGPARGGCGARTAGTSSSKACVHHTKRRTATRRGCF